MSKAIGAHSFLDSTPRQWIASLRYFIPKHESYIISLILHGSLLFFMPIDSLQSLNINSPKISASIMEISVVPQKSEEIYADIKNGSEEYLISKKKKINKKSENQKIDDLLKTLKSQKNINWSNKIQQPVFKSEKGIKQLNLTPSMSIGQVVMSMNDPKKDEVDLKKEDQNLLLKLIDSHQPAFRKCYEGAKLEDQNISGEVSVNLQYNGTQNLSEINFQGQGSAASRNQLTSCLKKVSVQIPIKKVKSDVIIKFGLVFI
ncbi:MAG TPA: hypothetical protein PLJ21_12260 [Pseudobdellovibrionaceae bacterium]|nr:hypothetical protein [Pseudobdellovibrionaceae bacterium]